MKEIKRDGAVLSYHTYGTGKTTLLFVHGSYIDQTYWQQQADYFSPAYTVVTFDLAGHGKSGYGRKNWSMKGFAEDVVAIIKELNLQKVILIGHSIGGDINLIAANIYAAPLIGFIVIDIFKNVATPLPAAMQLQVTAILQNLKTDFANTNEKYAATALLTPQTPPQIATRVIKDYRNALPPMGMATMPKVFEMYKIEKKLLPALPLKIYLANVNYMPTNEAPLKQYAAKGYELLHMQGTCHYPMLEHPDELNTLLQQCIEKITKKKVPPKLTDKKT